MSAQIIPFPTPAPDSEIDDLAQKMVARLDGLDNLSDGLLESARALRHMIKNHWHKAPEMLRYKLVSAYSELLCLNECNPGSPERRIL